MTLSALGIFSAAGAGGVPQTYELISTTVLGSNQPSVTFSNLGTYSSTYKHLQIRSVARTAQSSNTRAIGVRVNGISTSSYSWHLLEGDSSSVVSAAAANQTNGFIGHLAASGAAANIFGASVIDILDPFSSTKNTTLRGLSGATTSGENRVRLYSTLFNSTATVTSITLYSEDLTSNLVAGSRFSLYGIRG